MNKTTLIAVLLAAVFLLSSAASAWALYSRFEQANRNRSANARVWRAVICSIEVAVKEDKKSSAAEKHAAYKFYDGLLVNSVHTSPCGLSAR